MSNEIVTEYDDLANERGNATGEKRRLRTGDVLLTLVLPPVSWAFFSGYMDVAQNPRVPAVAFWLVLGIALVANGVGVFLSSRAFSAATQARRYGMATLAFLGFLLSAGTGGVFLLITLFGLTLSGMPRC